MANVVKPISTKNIKISQVSWQTPVVPATWEAELGESLEPGGRVAVSQDGATALQPGTRSETLSQKTNKHTHKQQKNYDIYDFGRRGRLLSSEGSWPVRSPNRKEEKQVLEGGGARAGASCPPGRLHRPMQQVLGGAVALAARGPDACTLKKHACNI